jgi:hypothetical protein
LPNEIFSIFTDVSEAIYRRVMAMMVEAASTFETSIILKADSILGGIPGNLL